MSSVASESWKVRQSPWGLASVCCGVLIVVGELLILAGGLSRNAKSLWLLTAILAGVMGWTLAMISLTRVHEGRRLAHWGIWLNGLIAFFALPAAMAWMLAGR